MLTFHPTRIFKRSRHVLLASAVACSIAASLALTGCESALSSDYDARGMSGDRGFNMMLARQAYDGTYTGEDVQSPTLPGGVHEARVDSPGPADPNTSIPTAPVTSETDIPTTNATQPNQPNPIESQANDVGLEAAMLNQKEGIFNLSLQDAIARTMKNALSIKVEAYNPAIDEAKLVQDEAAYDPVAFASSQWNETDEPQLQSGAITNGHVWQNQIGIRKLLPTGGNISVSGTSTYREIDQPALAGVTLPSSFANNLNLTLNQPLLRGFGTDVNYANIYADRRDYRISLSTFRRQVITTVAQVEEAYHTLVLDRTTVDIDEQLLAATEDTERRVWDRRAIDADKVSVNQAIAAVQLRRAELITARQTLRDDSDKLKNLINDPDISVRENILLNPTDKPIAEPIVISTRETIETALHQRTELQEGRLNIEKAHILIVVAKNDLLPTLNMTASVQSNGLDEGFDQATYGAAATGDHMDYGVGLKLEIPIGNRASEAEFAKDKRQLEQVETQLLEAAQSVVLDVKLQIRNVMARYQEIHSRQQALQSAQDELRAIIDKESISQLTPEFLELKLDSQNRLADAEKAMIQAIVSYNIGIERLEQSKGTLLEFDRISLDRPPIEDDENKIRFLGQTINLGK